MPRCRTLLGQEPELPQAEPLDLVLWLTERVGVDIHLCPWCGQRGMLLKRGDVDEVPLLWLMLKAFIGVFITAPVQEVV